MAVTTGHVMIQSNTNNPNENRQPYTWKLCFRGCGLETLTVTSCVAIIIGGCLVGLGIGREKNAAAKKTFDKFSSSEIQSEQTTINIGKGFLIAGVILFLICIILCCKFKCRSCNGETDSGTAMTAITAPPNNTDSHMVQHAHFQGTDHLPIYAQQPLHQGSSQHVQPVHNRYSPVPPGNEQYYRVYSQEQQSVVQPASNRYSPVPSGNDEYYPEIRPQPSAPDLPPPSYDELMHHQDKKMTLV